MVNGNRVFFCGGELRSHDGGAFGQQAVDFVSRFNVQYAVLSAGAINADTGFMLHDLNEADLTRAAAARARTRIVLADAAKFDQRAPITMAGQNDIDMLITEAGVPQAIANMLERREIALVTAK